MRTRISLILALMALAIFSSMSIASAAYTTYKFDLAGPAINGSVPIGRATYQEDDSIGARRLLITVGRVKMPTEVLDVVVDDVDVGDITIKVSNTGQFLLWTSEGDVVPDMAADSTIVLQTQVVAPATPVMVLTVPTESRFWYMTAGMTGAKIIDKTPLGRVTYRETDFGYTRRIRVLGQNVNLKGQTLEVFVGATKIGEATVSNTRVFVFTKKLLDTDPVNNLDSNSVVRVKKTDGTLVLQTGAWSVVDPFAGQ